jgi:hypothetical protein
MKLKEIRTYQAIGINGKFRAETHINTSMQKFKPFQLVLDGDIVKVSVTSTDPNSGEQVIDTSYVPLTNICYYKPLVEERVSKSKSSSSKNEYSSKGK